MLYIFYLCDHNAYFIVFYFWMKCLTVLSYNTDLQLW